MKEKLDKLMPLVYSYCQHTNMDSDYIREKILEALYRIHNKARGKKSLLVGIRDLTQEVKKDLPKIRKGEIVINTSEKSIKQVIEEILITLFTKFVSNCYFLLDFWSKIYVLLLL